MHVFEQLEHVDSLKELVGIPLLQLEQVKLWLQGQTSKIL
jgi:hypothetical protein